MSLQVCAKVPESEQKLPDEERDRERISVSFHTGTKATLE